jgi:hypothetical protein
VTTLLAVLDGGAAVGIAFWICVAAVVIAPSLAHYRYKAREAELSIALKQEMVARGFSAEEILAVVNNQPKSLAGKELRASAMTPSKLPA